tara:strand:+ start:234 stop:440 length:207 start_codon:yes stop_codon:yes gene_type:complete
VRGFVVSAPFFPPNATENERTTMKKTEETRRAPVATNERTAPPLPDAQEVVRRCREERLGHRFAENMF